MKWTLIFGLFATLLVSCSESDDNEFADSVCDKIAVVDLSGFQHARSEGFSIQRLQVNGDCLEVVIEAGGCSGETWETELIDAGRVAESYPEQREAKLLFQNEELCNAVVTRTFSFDLRPLRTQSGKVILHLEHWDEPILYEY